MDVVWKGIAGGLVAVCYFAVDRVDYRIALLGGLAAWPWAYSWRPAGLNDDLNS